MAKKTTQINEQSLTRSIQLSIGKLEALAAARADVMAYVESDIKELDKAAKAEKTVLQGIVEGIRDITLAVALCNAIAPTVPNADDSLRNRLSKRRGRMVNILRNVYTDYDVMVEKGKYSKGIIYAYVGDATVREARELLKTLGRLVTLGAAKAVKISEETLAANIKAERNLSTSEKSGTVSKVDGISKVDLNAGYRLAKIDLAGMRDRILAKAGATTKTAADVTAAQEEIKEAAEA